MNDGMNDGADHSPYPVWTSLQSDTVWSAGWQRRRAPGGPVLATQPDGGGHDAGRAL